MKDEAILPVVRHVPTALNEQGVSRGWLAAPPDPEKLEELGPGIAKALQRYKVSELVSSDLPRARKTAEWLGKEMEVPVSNTYDLRTWNSGSDVAGKKESVTIPIRQKYIRNPDTKPRGGEEFQDFLNRNESTLQKLLDHNRENPEAPKAAVLHGHHMMALEDMFSGRGVDPKRLDTLDKDFPPGSVALLRVNGGSAKLERVHPKGFQEEL